MDFLDVRLSELSPCIDRGDGSVVAPDSSDLKGTRRIQNGVVDIGADEFSGELFESQILFVSANGDDQNSGKSWAASLRSIGQAIRLMPKTGAEIWVKNGIHFEQVSLRLFSYLYGGFHGNELSKAERSNFEPTIIDCQHKGSVLTASPSSPCVDAGENSLVSLGETDVDGQPRIVSGKVDIGADEVLFRIDTKRQGVALEVFGSEVFAPNYVLQASTNLVDWATVDIGTSPRFRLQSLDAIARFFRVLAAP